MAPGALAGIFPTHGGEACIWVCTSESVARRHQRRGARDEVVTGLLAELAPRLRDRVGGARQTSPVRGMLRMPNHLRQAAGPGWALVGDAGYHRDAVTGHGISDAFRDAELLATALDAALRDPGCESKALAGYGRHRDRMARPDLRPHLRARRLPRAGALRRAAARARGGDRRPGRRARRLAASRAATTAA